MEENEGWLGGTEAAERAGVSRVTVWRAANRGELPYATVAATRYFLAADLDEWRERMASINEARAAYTRARRRRAEAVTHRAHAPHESRPAAAAALKLADEELAAAAGALREAKA